LKEDPSIPVLASVGRIDHQKGLDIAFSAIRDIKERDWYFILLGKGDPILEKEAFELQAIFPDRVRVIVKYDSALSRLIYGGADIFMMPSRYEPCGLAQMIAMRYGCIPVVHATGGLKDTVIEKRTGFLYNDNEPQALANTLAYVLDFYSNQDAWQTMQQRAMRADFSWAKSAGKYSAVYQSLIS
jgi:starch synthase